MFNLLMALAISLVIAVIASVKDVRTKAVVYSLPLPITLALIASQKGVDASHIVGLSLLVGFLWLAFFLHEKWKMHILVADVISATTYVGIGYLFARIAYLPNAFVILCISFVIVWFAYRTVCYYQKSSLASETKTTLPEESSQKSPSRSVSVSQNKRIPIWLKTVVVFVTAFALLETKDFLAGVIVTFPFSGVFAVLEMKSGLRTLASEFAKNSIAILAFFIVISFATSSIGLPFSILLGWTAYLIVVQANKLFA